jgi:hypothetical protein
MAVPVGPGRKNKGFVLQFPREDDFIPENSL